MDKQVMVRVDAATYDALQRYAETTERTISQVIRFAIKGLLAKGDGSLSIYYRHSDPNGKICQGSYDDVPDELLNPNTNSKDQK